MCILHCNNLEKMVTGLYEAKNVQPAAWCRSARKGWYRLFAAIYGGTVVEIYIKVDEKN